MSSNNFIIKAYQPEYEDDVIELWHRCGLYRPWNDPVKEIERKLKVNPELFLVGLIDGKVAATVMGGYEGHRGWLSYVAVDPAYRHRGLGRQIMQAIEAELKKLGCPKINIQIRNGNEDVASFYQSIGYKPDDVFGMGKRLVDD